ncbi:hypothetical protein Tco_0103619 [Tanacetum coccineum]
MDMAPTKKAFRIYNRRTRRIIKTIHVDFDELTAMASERNSSGPALHEMTPVSIKHQKSLLPILKQLHPEQAVSQLAHTSSTTVFIKMHITKELSYNTRNSNSYNSHDVKQIIMI